MLIVRIRDRSWWRCRNVVEGVNEEGVVFVILLGDVCTSGRGILLRDFLLPPLRGLMLLSTTLCEAILLGMSILIAVIAMLVRFPLTFLCLCIGTTTLAFPSCISRHRRIGFGVGRNVLLCLDVVGFDVESVKEGFEFQRLARRRCASLEG